MVAVGLLDVAFTATIALFLTSSTPEGALASVPNALRSFIPEANGGSALGIVLLVVLAGRLVAALAQLFVSFIFQTQWIGRILRGLVMAHLIPGRRSQLSTSAALGSETLQISQIPDNWLGLVSESLVLFCALIALLTAGLDFLQLLAILLTIGALVAVGVYSSKTNYRIGGERVKLSIARIAANNDLTSARADILGAKVHDLFQDRAVSKNYQYFRSLLITRYLARLNPLALDALMLLFALYFLISEKSNEIPALFIFIVVLMVRFGPKLFRVMTAIERLSAIEKSCANFINIIEIGRWPINPKTAQFITAEAGGLKRADFDEVFGGGHLAFSPPIDITAAGSLIVGPSGIGKSKFLESLHAGFGAYTFDYKSHVGYALPGTSIYIPQRPALVKGNIYVNVSFKSEQEISLEDEQRISVILARLKVVHFAIGMDFGEHHRDLSGGERLKLGLARALYSDARYILLDEPTSSLDGDSYKDVVSILQFEVDAKKRRLIIVTHDERLISSFSHFRVSNAYSE